MLRLIWQFTRFSFVGGTCFAIDYGLMVLLTEVCDIRYIYSLALSFIIATIINYFLSVRFVFNHQGHGNQDLGVFVVLGAIGLGLNQIIMFLLVDQFIMHYMIAKLIAGIVVSFYNFASRKTFLER